MQRTFWFIDSDRFPKVISLNGLSSFLHDKFSFISFRKRQHGGKSIESEMRAQGFWEISQPVAAQILSTKQGWPCSLGKLFVSCMKGIININNKNKINEKEKDTESKSLISVREIKSVYSEIEKV